MYQVHFVVPSIFPSLGPGNEQRGHQIQILAQNKIHAIRKFPGNILIKKENLDN